MSQALIETVPSWVPLLALIATWVAFGLAWVIADEISVRRRRKSP